MKSEIIHPINKKSPLTFPVALQWRGTFHPNPNPSNVYQTGEKQLVVLFFSSTCGVVIHRKDNPRTLGEYSSNFADANEACWEPFIGQVTLTFP